MRLLSLSTHEYFMEPEWRICEFSRVGRCARFPMFCVNKVRFRAHDESLTLKYPKSSTRSSIISILYWASLTI